MTYSREHTQAHKSYNHEDPKPGHCTKRMGSGTSFVIVCVEVNDHNDDANKESVEAINESVETINLAYVCLYATIWRLS